MGPNQQKSVFISADLETSLPADGSARRSIHSRHNFRKEEPGSSLLLVLAQVQDLADGQRHRATSRYKVGPFCQNPPNISHFLKQAILFFVIFLCCKLSLLLLNQPRLDKRWRSSGSCSLQDCQIRANQVFGDRTERVYRDLRMVIILFTSLPSLIRIISLYVFLIKI